MVGRPNSGAMHHAISMIRAEYRDPSVLKTCVCHENPEASLNQFYSHQMSSRVIRGANSTLSNTKNKMVFLKKESLYIKKSVYFFHSFFKSPASLGVYIFPQNFIIAPKHNRLVMKILIIASNLHAARNEIS